MLKSKALECWGNPKGSILVVVDSPSASEVRAGKVLAQAQAQMLEYIAQLAGIDLDQICAINAMPSRPSDKPTVEQLQTTGRTHIRQYLPDRKLVVCMGNEAAVAMKLLDKLQGIKGISGSPRIHKFGAAVVATMSLWAILADPGQVTQVAAHFIFGLDWAEAGGRPELPTIEQVPLLHPREIKSVMLAELLKHNATRLAYDHETTAAQTRIAKIATMCFYGGVTSPGGHRRVYTWAAYDQLRAIWTDEEMARWLRAWEDFFTTLPTTIKLVGHNSISFDDQVLRQVFGHDQARLGGWRGCDIDTMVLHYVVDKTAKHGLKEIAPLYAGIYDWEEGLGESIKAITKRRGNILRHEDDFRTLEFFGIEPDYRLAADEDQTTLPGLYRKCWWPKALDKKIAAWALQPLDELLEYNSYDAVATYEVCLALEEIIKARSLEKNAEIRHEISRFAAEPEYHGMYVDEERRQQAIAVCREKAASALRMLRSLSGNEEFNPNSSAQVLREIYGLPRYGWTVDALRTAELMESQGSKRWDALQEIEEWQLRWEVACWRGETDMALTDEPEERPAEKKRLRQILNQAFFTDFGIKPAAAYKAIYRAHCQDQKYARPLAWTKTGMPSTGKDILKPLAAQTRSPFILNYLVYTRASKIDGTFLTGLDKHLIVNDDSTIHPRYNTTGPKTGRLSSSNPNGQNQPSAVRGIVVPRTTGWSIVSFDASQLELRVIAAFSNDSTLKSALSGGDLHSEVARMVFHIAPDQPVPKASRDAAKTLNFAIWYGASALRVATMLGIGVEEAQAMMDRYLDTFPEAKAWKQRLQEQAKQPPFEVSTAFGTKISVLGAISFHRRTASAAERLAVNAPIQGTGGEMVPLIGIGTHRRMHEQGYAHDLRFINTVHDSLTWEASPRVAWPSGRQDKDGFDIPEGPLVDAVNAAAREDFDFSPLNRVEFLMDGQIGQCWYGEPNPAKAIDAAIKGFEIADLLWETEEEGGSLEWALRYEDLLALRRKKPQRKPKSTK